jgi:hypothetical protein
MGRKSHHLMERVYAHLSKNGCQKSGFLADPELTVTLFIQIPNADHVLCLRETLYRIARKAISLARQYKVPLIMSATLPPFREASSRSLT